MYVFVLSSEGKGVLGHDDTSLAKPYELATVVIVTPHTASSYHIYNTDPTCMYIYMCVNLQTS